MSELGGPPSDSETGTVPDPSTAVAAGVPALGPQEPEERLCTECGAEIPADSRYCGICGQDTQGKANQRAVIATLTLAQILQLVGFTAGAVAFAGFFVDFFGVGGTTLASASSFWFDLVPISVGISALCVFLPMRGYVVSGLPLLAVGIAFGARGLLDAATRAPGYGAGFWMIVVGSIALTLCWAAIDFTQDQRKKAS